MNGVKAITLKTKEVYRIAFSFKGVQCREYVALAHSKAAETYCTRLRGTILAEIERNTFVYSDHFPESPRAALFGHGPGKSRTLKEALEAYRDRTKTTLELSTWNGYRRAIDNVLIPWCGAIRTADFRASHARDWVGVQGVTLKRIRNVLLPLRAVLDEAVDDGVIKLSPLRTLKLAKLVPIEKRTSDFEADPYTVDELRTLLGNLPEPERWTFQLWAYTGMRNGELIGLRWPRVSLEAKTIRVIETTTEGADKPRTKTKAGMRTIPALPAALEALEGMRRFTQLADDRVTVNPRGRREDKAWDSNKLASVWQRAHRRTGIAPRNPYQLRHTFASQLLSQGENPAYIAKLLGHKTIDMVTRTYGRWVSEGEKLGFDRPPRRYGMEPLWTAPIMVRI